MPRSPRRGAPTTRLRRGAGCGAVASCFHLCRRTAFRAAVGRGAEIVAAGGAKIDFTVAPPPQVQQRRAPGEDGGDNPIHNRFPLTILVADETVSRSTGSCLKTNPDDQLASARSALDSHRKPTWLL